MASSISFWRVLISVHSPFWRVFEKYGFPHCNSGSQEEFEDTKGVIRICKSKNDRHHNGQQKKDKSNKLNQT